MHENESFWTWLIASIAAIAAAIRQFAAFGNPSPVDPDDWTPIPPLTAKIVEQYAFAGCNDREIADRFLVDEEYLRREFTPVLRATRGLRAYRLHYGQTKLALDGNSPTLIWLGKNVLGQSNNPSPQGPPEPDVQQ